MNRIKTNDLKAPYFQGVGLKHERAFNTRGRDVVFNLHLHLPPYRHLRGLGLHNQIPELRRRRAPIVPQHAVADPLQQRLRARSTPPPTSEINIHVEETPETSASSIRSSGRVSGFTARVMGDGRAQPLWCRQVQFSPTSYALLPGRPTPTPRPNPTPGVSYYLPRRRRRPRRPLARRFRRPCRARGRPPRLRRPVAGHT